MCVNTEKAYFTAESVGDELPGLQLSDCQNGHPGVTHVREHSYLLLSLYSMKYFEVGRKIKDFNWGGEGPGHSSWAGGGDEQCSHYRKTLLAYSSCRKAKEDQNFCDF